MCFPNSQTYLTLQDPWQHFKQDQGRILTGREKGRDYTPHRRNNINKISKIAMWKVPLENGAQFSVSKGQGSCFIRNKNGKEAIVLIVKASHVRLRNFEFMLWEI